MLYYNIGNMSLIEGVNKEVNELLTSEQFVNVNLPWNIYL